MSVSNITFYPNKSASLNLTQLEVLAQYANGLPAKTIAHELQKATPTIVNHLNTARSFYRAKNTTHAACMAIACGDITYQLQSKEASNHTAASRCGAIAFALLACVVSLQDTPFVGLDDSPFSRHNRGERHARNHKTAKRNQSESLNLIIV